MRVNLIYRDNQAGLFQDARIVDGILTAAGARVSHSASTYWEGRKRRIIRRVAKLLPARYELNIFFQDVQPAWIPFARFNVLIPNQEWFDLEWLPYLRLFDRVFCKTREAEHRFVEVGAAVEYVGFTSRDMLLAEPTPKAEGALHLAGRSLQKGTEALGRVWHRHPEWPRLTIVQRSPNPEHLLRKFPAPNIHYIDEFQAEEVVQKLQNSIAIHACPSEAEGYGHVLSESLSCGAVLVTTDAPPMNELVQAGRGLLVAVTESSPQLMGTCHIVSEPHLEERMAEALGMPAPVREQMGTAARRWFLENDAAFRERFPAAISRLLGG